MYIIRLSINTNVFIIYFSAKIKEVANSLFFFFEFTSHATQDPSTIECSFSSFFSNNTAYRFITHGEKATDFLLLANRPGHAREEIA